MNSQEVVYEVRYTKKSKIQNRLVRGICFGELAYKEVQNPKHVASFVYYPRPYCCIGEHQLDLFFSIFSELYPELKGLTAHKAVTRGIKVDARKRSCPYILNLFRFIRMVAEEPWAITELRRGYTLRQNLGVVLLCSFVDLESGKFVDTADNFLKGHKYCHQVHSHLVYNFLNNFDKYFKGASFVDNQNPGEVSLVCFRPTGNYGPPAGCLPYGAKVYALAINYFYGIAE